MVNKSSNKNDISQETTPKQSVKEDTQKTSGGISKRLLTPCRRVGLSKNRKNTPIGLTPPFSTPKISENRIEDDIDSTPKLKKTKISKLCNEKSQVSLEKSESMKNLQRTDSEAVESSQIFCFLSKPDHITTPVKEKQEYIVKKHNGNKTYQKNDFSEEIIDPEEEIHQNGKDFENILDNATVKTPIKKKNVSETKDGTIEDEENLLSELQKDSVNMNVEKKYESPVRKCKVIIKKMESKERIAEASKRLKQCLDDENLLDFEKDDSVPLKRFKSVNNLTKVSPSQKKPEAGVKKKNHIEKKSHKTRKNTEVNLKKSCIKVIERKILNKSDSLIDLSDSMDEDFDSFKQNIKEKKMTQKMSPKLDKVKKPEQKSILGHKDDILNIKGKTKKNNKGKPLNRSLSTLALFQNSPKSTSSYTDDDDDFEFNTKKTILIRKTYNKNKPHLVRSKTTGSITEKDLEGIKRRIERKRNKIIEAEKVEKRTLDELKTAIEKWRIGCQQALNELLDIMKKNIPNKENMDIEELLNMLNIPIGLVKYNTEEFCFE